MTEIPSLRPLHRPRQKIIIPFGLFFAASITLSIILVGLSLFFMGPHSYNPPGRAYLSDNKRGNFGYMQYTGKLTSPVLEITAGETALDVAEMLTSWKRQGTKTINLRPSYDLSSKTTRSVSSLVFQQLGTRNPWEAFPVGSKIIVFYLDKARIAKEAVIPLSEQVDKSSQDASLVIKDGWAIKFQPDRIGKKLDRSQSIRAIITSLFQEKSSVDLPVIKTRPARTLADTNSLGIKELVAVGESDFSGSTASRITNIRVGSEKFNGIILAPEEEFSFNHFLGPVTADAGFKPELVIKSNGTVPELGGGICQVSTTAFRAALYGGLKISARKNHSYAVKYYAPQGTDATIYPGVVDFKFVNDTKRHLLVWTKMEGNKLYFEFYGTKDNRQVEIDGPYQYDFGPGNAMKARLSRIVTTDSGTQKDDFYSKYVSQDLFPRIYEYPDGSDTEKKPGTSIPGQDTGTQTTAPDQQTPAENPVPADNEENL